MCYTTVLFQLCLLVFALPNATKFHKKALLTIGQCFFVTTIRGNSVSFERVAYNTLPLGRACGTDEDCHCVPEAFVVVYFLIWKQSRYSKTVD
jgi:hypothetical protein